MGDRAREQLAGTRFGGIRWVEETGSTNRDLLEAAAHGAGEGAVLVADHQSAGRGRLGRAWQAPAGASLLMSVLVRPAALAVGDAHRLTMALAVAAVDACAEVAGVEVSLKWPNDLVIGDRKLAGILAESSVASDRLTAVVLGMGLNVNWPSELPEDLATIAVALNHVAGREIDREDLLVAVLRGFDRSYPPPADIAARYQARLATLGRKVRVELPDPAASFEGLAVDVGADGHLVVETPGGDRREIAAADVVHLR